MPEPERRCQCREPASSLESQPCPCGNDMTAEDLLCDSCRWAAQNLGGCLCHISSLVEHDAHMKWQRKLETERARS